MLDSGLWLVSAVFGLAQAVVGLVSVVIVTRHSMARARVRPETVGCVLGVAGPVVSGAESPTGRTLIVWVCQRDLSEWEGPGA